MITKRNLLIKGGLFVAVAGAGIAYKTLVPKTYAAQSTYKVNGIAIGGTDPVAYFTQNKPVLGSATYMTGWNDAVWYFATAQNRDTFAATPEKYAPQYGGFCAWAVAARKKLYSTQAENWTIENDKLYLNYNSNIQGKWEQNKQRFIIDGDRFWPGLSQA